MFSSWKEYNTDHEDLHMGSRTCWTRTFLKETRQDCVKEKIDTVSKLSWIDVKYARKIERNLILTYLRINREKLLDMYVAGHYCFNITLAILFKGQAFYAQLHLFSKFHQHYSVYKGGNLHPHDHSVLKKKGHRTYELHRLRRRRDPPPPPRPKPRYLLSTRYCTKSLSTILSHISYSNVTPLH